MRDIENSHDKKYVACTAGLCKMTCYQGQHVFQPQNISGMKKNIEIEMYYGPKYNKTAGNWCLTLVRLVNFSFKKQMAQARIFSKYS